MFRRAWLALPLALVACGDDFERNLKEADMYPLLSTGEATGVAPTTGPGTGANEPTSTGTGGGEATTIDETTGESGSGSGTGDATAVDPGTSTSVPGELLLPEVLEIDVPSKVSVAGPVPFTATTLHAASARARLDGVDLGPLTDEGGGLYSGAVAIYGSVDAGDHVLEVIAENGILSDVHSAMFTVDTPAPGSPAWTMAGPTGSRTRRIAVTPEGDVLEVGTLASGGVARPAIRKRSGVTGAELWPGGTIVLDDRQGEAVDVAVAPDGRLWVAMNVREALNKWRPRIVLLDAAGKMTGVEVPTATGHTVQGIASDGAGGCFAVGFAGTGFGDADVVVWRMNEALVPVLSGKTWDYVPVLEQGVHTFSDFATDVVVRDGVGWIVGFSDGLHDPKDAKRSRGIIVRMNVDTAAVLGPVIIAPKSDPWTQSMFFGAAAHPAGVLVTGTGCDNACDVQRVETALYTDAGARSWFRPEKPAAQARGNDVAVGEHDVIVVAATMGAGAEAQGLVFGRVLYGNGDAFNAPFPASKEPSEALGAAVGPFDRIYAGGYRTFGGVPDAWVLHLHP